MKRICDLETYVHAGRLLKPVHVGFDERSLYHRACCIMHVQCNVHASCKLTVPAVAVHS